MTFIFESFRVFRLQIVLASQRTQNKFFAFFVVFVVFRQFIRLRSGVCFVWLCQRQLFSLCEKALLFHLFCFTYSNIGRRYNCIFLFSSVFLRSVDVIACGAHAQVWKMDTIGWVCLLRNKIARKSPPGMLTMRNEMDEFWAIPAQRMRFSTVILNFVSLIFFFTKLKKMKRKICGKFPHRLQIGLVVIMNSNTLGSS